MGRNDSIGQPAGVVNSALSTLNGVTDSNAVRPAESSSERVPPIPVALAAVNGTSGLDLVTAAHLNGSRGILSGASTPLSSPPANSPPAYHPSPLNGLSRLSGTASTALTSLPPSSAPGSPKPFTAAQKGKGKASAPTEPRVVRARRSTASLGMAVGMGGMGGIGDRKEIEELVWECRDRMATPGMTDGTDLPPLLLTTLALDDVRPQPTIYDPNAASTSTAPIKPAVNLAVASAQAQIETPSFRIVDAKEDEERSGRLRKRVEESEETMDAHYHHLHKKYETFEKRQRRREKERLQHERYKMKERVDLIRTMDAKSFASLVASGAPPAEDGTVKRSVHPEEIRTKMLEEAEEVLQRYDQVLKPIEDRMKQKRLEDLADDSASDSFTPPPPSTYSHSAAMPRTSSSLRLSSTQPTLPRSTSSLSIKLRMPTTAQPSPTNHSAALPFHPTTSSKPSRRSKRVRISAYDERSTSEEEGEEEESASAASDGDDEADMVVVTPSSRRPARGRVSHTEKPVSKAKEEKEAEVEVHDEFRYWPRVPLGGVPMLERTSMRHLETVEKDLAAAAAAADQPSSIPMDIDPPASAPEPKMEPQADVGVDLGAEAGRPTKRQKKDDKTKLVKTLAGTRAARFNTPWGIKIPEITGWKNEFDLDGEFWLPVLNERMEQRKEREEAADTLEALARGLGAFAGKGDGEREKEGSV